MTADIVAASMSSIPESLNCSGPAGKFGGLAPNIGGVREVALAAPVMSRLAVPGPRGWAPLSRPSPLGSGAPLAGAPSGWILDLNCPGGLHHWKPHLPAHRGGL